MVPEGELPQSGSLSHLQLKEKIKIIQKFCFYVKLFWSQFHEILQILILTLKECIDGYASK